VPKVESAVQATDIAVDFLKKHFPILHRPMKATREQETWAVEVDVGPFLVKVARVSIDAETGEITSYEIP
jgi:hypothetical protein